MSLKHAILLVEKVVWVGDVRVTRSAECWVTTVSGRARCALPDHSSEHGARKSDLNVLCLIDDW